MKGIATVKKFANSFYNFSSDLTQKVSVILYLVLSVFYGSKGWGQCPTDQSYTATASPTCNTLTTTLQGPGHKTTVSGFSQNKVYNLYVNTQTNNVNCVQARWLNSGGGAIGGWFSLNYANNAAVNYGTHISPANAAQLEITTGKTTWVSTSAILNYRINPTPSAGVNTTINCGQSVQLGETATSMPNPVFSWSPSIGLSASNVLNPSASPLSTTTYTLTIATSSGATGCSPSSQVTVTVNPFATIKAGSGIISECGPGPFNLVGSSDATTTYSCNNNNSLTAACAPTYNSGNYSDHISRIRTTGAAVNIDNNSGTSGSPTYSDFTSSQVIKIYEGSDLSMNFWCNDAYNHGVGLWVDKNNNGNFDDAGEFLLSGTSTTGERVGTARTADLSPGKYRLRVRSRYSATPDNGCSDQGYGEAEDYTLEVKCLPSFNILNANFNASDNGFVASTYSSANNWVRGTTSWDGMAVNSGGTNYFYLKSDGGTSTAGESYLRSPAFSTQNTSNAVVSFRHYFYQALGGANSKLYVEYSTDNSSWGGRVEITHSGINKSSIGAYNNFATYTLDIPAGYQNKPTVYFRFVFTIQMTGDGRLTM